MTASTIPRVLSDHWTALPYEHAGAPDLMFAVPGVPQPQGSKVAHVVNGRAVLREAVKGLKPWRDAVTKAAVAALHSTPPPDGGWPLIGPVCVVLAFSMPKPRSAPKRTRTFPVVKPDVDKLARAVLDALTYAGVVADDSQVVDLHAYKVYPTETPRALRVPGLVGLVYRVTS